MRDGGQGIVEEHMGEAGVGQEHLYLIAHNMSQEVPPYKHCSYLYFGSYMLVVEHRFIWTGQMHYGGRHMAEQETKTIPSGPQESVELQFRPFESPYLENPVPFLAYARQEKPIFFSPLMNLWVVTRYDDMATILKDPQRFSSRNWFTASARLAPATMQILKGTMFDSDSGGLVQTDPPIHTRLRRALTGAFSARLVAQLEDQIRTLTANLIDAFPEQDPLDFVEHFGRKLPVQVLCRLIGIPDKDADWIRKSCDEVEILFIQTLPEDQQQALAHSYIDLFNYIGELLDQRQVSPQDDLATAFQNSGQDKLSRSEFIELLITLLTAGIGTSTHFLPACVHLLLEHGAWKTLDHSPEYLGQVVDEALRLVSPIQGVFRMTTEEVELGGVTVPANALVYAVVASANRDQQRFPNPDVIDLQRDKNTHHMVFGYGIHHCIGAPVVKLEARIALEMLHERFPNLRIARNHPPLRYLPGLLMRGMEQLFLERG